MTIAIVTGPPGFGKSYYATRLIDEALSKGQHVVTNIEPTFDWVERAARRNPRHALRSKAAKQAVYDRLDGQMHVVTTIEDLIHLREPGCGRCRACKAGHDCETEDRWLVVLDELQLWLDARGWKDERLDRKPILGWFTLHRKLGAKVIVLTQHELNIDSAVRRCFEVHVKLKALHKVKVAGVRVVPFKWFLAFHYFNDGTRMLMRRESFGLSKRVAGMYRTMAVSAQGTPDPDRLVFLGAPRAYAKPRKTRAVVETRTSRRQARLLAELDKPAASEAAPRGGQRRAAPVRCDERPDRPGDANPAASAQPPPALVALSDAVGLAAKAAAATDADSSAPRPTPSLAARTTDTSDPAATLPGQATMRSPLRTNAPELATPTRSTSTTDISRDLGSPPG